MGCQEGSKHLKSTATRHRVLERGTKRNEVKERGIVNRGGQERKDIEEERGRYRKREDNWDT